MERKGNRIAERQLGTRTSKCSTHHCATREEAPYTSTADAITLGGRGNQSPRGRQRRSKKEIIGGANKSVIAHPSTMACLVHTTKGSPLFPPLSLI